jgi:hypothetical protein
MQDWIVPEIASVKMGDKRLNDRCGIVLDQLSLKPSVSIPAAAGGNWNDTKSIYRFFDNERVSETEILRPHREATTQRIRQEKVVLLIQDTTEIDLTRREEKVDDAGPLNEESRWGYYAHLLLAITPESVPLGVVNTHVWGRDLAEFTAHKGDKKAKEKEKKDRGIEDKESNRWLAGYQKGCEIAEQAQDTLVVVVSDSEGDIFECFLESVINKGKHKASWLIRACQDRRLAEKGPGHSWKKLWQDLRVAEVSGRLRINISKSVPSSKDKRKRKQARSAREALVEVRAKTVTIRGPERTNGRLANTVVNAVYVREISPPPTGEQPLDWLLLTCLPICTFEEVCKVIDYYCCRWQIEIYFRVLKSGCKVEQLQFEKGHNYRAALAMYMIIAWRVMYVLMLGRECPEMSCDLLFSEAEWKAVYMVVKKMAPPAKPPTLGVMVLLIASLGGYLGRKHDGPPGPKTMWIGMQRMADLAEAWRTFGHSEMGG